VVSAVDLVPRTRLETWIEFQEGLDFSEMSMIPTTLENISRQDGV
jgi:hypothetical protein